MKKFSILILMAVFALTACRERGPAEEAGRNLDEAASDLGDRVREIGDNISDSVQ